MVRFIDKLTPFITNERLIRVESVGGGMPATQQQRTLEQYLGDLLDALLDLGPMQKSTGEYTIKLSCKVRISARRRRPARHGGFER